MKKIFILFTALSVISLFAQDVQSPSGNIKLHFILDKNGKPIYTVDYKDK